MPLKLAIVRRARFRCGGSCSCCLRSNSLLEFEVVVVVVVGLCNALSGLLAAH